MDLFIPESVQPQIDAWLSQAIAHLEPAEDDENAYQKLKEYNELSKTLLLKINKMRELIAHFNLPYLSLPVNTPKDVALQVFINMNTNSKPLTIYDIMVAEVENETQAQLHQLKKKLDEKYPNIKSFFELEFLILATSALLQEKLPNNRGMLEMKKPLIIENWEKMEKGLKRMSIFLESQGIFDKNRLPTNAVLSVIAASYASIPESGDEAGKGEILLKKYLWSAFFTERYENSAATRAYADYMGIRNVLLKKKKDDGKPYTEKDIPVLNRDLFELSDEAELLSVGWPTRAIIRARAIIAVTTYLGALDFADGKKVSRENLVHREYHHIFPSAFLEEADIKESLALNCALISGTTNRTISNKAPMKYLEQRYEWVDQSIVYERLKSHLIPIEELNTGGYDKLSEEKKHTKIKKDYDAFVKKRAELLVQAIHHLAQGVSITADSLYDSAFKLPEPLANLYQQIEQIELWLRAIIAEKLSTISADPYKHLIGPKVKASVENKIESHLKKFPQKNASDFKSFRQKLDFFTLGEYRELIIRKDCWDLFEPIFKSKSNVENRFNQLFTLRNTLAHNNELNDIIVLDGEAAIKWFNELQETYEKNIGNVE